MQGLVKSMSFSGEVKVNITFGVGKIGGSKKLKVVGDDLI